MIFLSGLMEALSEELRTADLFKGEKSRIKFTTIYPIMVNTGLVKNPRNRCVLVEFFRPCKDTRHYVTFHVLTHLEAITVAYITFLRSESNFDEKLTLLVSIHKIKL